MCAGSRRATTTLAARAATAPAAGRQRPRQREDRSASRPQPEREATLVGHGPTGAGRPPARLLTSASPGGCRPRAAACDTSVDAAPCRGSPSVSIAGGYGTQRLAAIDDVAGVVLVRQPGC